jgi:shikimate kinase
VTIRVVLVGLPGVGKSTIGAALAAALEVPFVDVDDVLFEQCGMHAATMLRERGEGAFRVAEERAVRAAVGRAGDVVVATGGGAVESVGVRELLDAEDLVVHLTADPLVVLERLKDGDRPLVEGQTEVRLASLADRRAAWYAEVADVSVDATGPVDVVVASICAMVVRT